MEILNNRLKSVDASDIINGVFVVPNGVLKISPSVFGKYNELVNGIKLNDDLIEIQSYAFESCTNLKELYIPKNVKELGDSFVANCTSLEVLHIEEGVEKIGQIFNNTNNLKTLILPLKSKYVHNLSISKHFADLLNLKEYFRDSNDSKDWEEFLFKLHIHNSKENLDGALDCYDSGLFEFKIK